MSKQSKYNSKNPDINGMIQWSDEENAIWGELYQRHTSLNELAIHYMDSFGPTRTDRV